MIQVNDNGVLHTVRLVQANDNCVLRNVRLIQVNDNGVLRNIHLGQVVLDDYVVPANVGGFGAAGIAFLANGRVEAGFADLGVEPIGSWHDPNVDGIGQHFEINIDQLSSSPAGLTGGPFSQWLTLDQARGMGYATPPLSGDITARVRIRDRYTQNVLATGSITLDGL